MGRDGDRLHPPGVLLAVLIHLGEDHGQRHPLAGADLFQSQIQLEDAALGLQGHVAQIHHHRVLTAADGQVHRDRTLLRLDHHVALHRHGGLRESHLVPLGVRVGDGLVDQLDAGRVPHMADEKFQGGALRGAHPQGGNSPAQGGVVQLHGAALARRGDAGDDKVGGHHLMDYDVGGPCLGNVGGQVGE